MLKATVAAIWAVVIGVPVGVVAGLLGFSLSEAGLVGFLGGLGAAFFILFFTVPSQTAEGSRDR